jgi:primosomal protein N'
MEFKVNFRAVVAKSGRSTRPDEEFDIREVSEIIAHQNIGAKLLNQFGLRAEDVSKNYISSMQNNIRVIVPQELADKSGKFENRPEIYVQVSQDILSEFVEIQVFDAKEGKELKYVAKEKELLDFWAENNFELLILSEADNEGLKARQARRDEIEAEKEKAEQEKESREQERKDWILAHGSQYLKDCLELGAKANKEYVIERAATEFPGYEVDYSDDAHWEEKFSPSSEALSELKKVRGLGAESEIVWLTRPINEDDEFEPCEAVAIRCFLGKYDLIKII